jgi:hypothetical protein
MADDNVVPLRSMDTAAQVFEDAMARSLKHVIVIGITEDGENYYQSTGCSTLAHMTWMTFCAENSMHRMIGNDAKGKI